MKYKHGSGITLDLLPKTGLCTESRKKSNKILEVQSINHSEQPLKKKKKILKIITSMQGRALATSFQKMILKIITREQDFG